VPRLPQSYSSVVLVSRARGGAQLCRSPSRSCCCSAARSVTLNSPILCPVWSADCALFSAPSTSRPAGAGAMPTITPFVAVCCPARRRSFPGDTAQLTRLPGPRDARCLGGSSVMPISPASNHATEPQPTPQRASPLVGSRRAVIMTVHQSGMSSAATVANLRRVAGVPASRDRRRVRQPDRAARRTPPVSPRPGDRRPVVDPASPQPGRPLRLQ
jgi:hypothetical protein